MRAKVVIINDDDMAALEECVPKLEELMKDVDKNLLSILRFDTIAAAADAARKAATEGKEVKVFTFETEWPYTEVTKGLGKGVKVTGVASYDMLFSYVEQETWGRKKKKKA